ncbi:cell division protein SepF [Anaerotalea alkaliphila]|uniref:Cell division protein SepF n=1 Tax=Anaerotalea alkaliphila TaxID=2662126 RepID=A0A7X5KNM2_9FIRM|nr:cell division protein SepF [Anaerotalea alkaliphila]NDL67938.1 cell division protein SepF [Anaerotalea alkaliphila]
MAKLFDKMMDFMKLNDEYSDEETNGYEDDFNSFTGQPQPVNAPQQQAPPVGNQGSEAKSGFKTYAGGRKSGGTKVVNFQANVQMEVVVLQPDTYDEAQEICDHIKSQRPVIINLEAMDKAIAQRIMDFVSGAVYTLNGNLQRVTNNIFIIAPENIDIAGDFREELKSNGIILPWKSE